MFAPHLRGCWKKFFSLRELIRPTFILHPHFPNPRNIPDSQWECRFTTQWLLLVRCSYLNQRSEPAPALDWRPVTKAATEASRLRSIIVNLAWLPNIVDRLLFLVTEPIQSAPNSRENRRDLGAVHPVPNSTCSKLGDKVRRTIPSRLTCPAGVNSWTELRRSVPLWWNIRRGDNKYHYSLYKYPAPRGTSEEDPCAVPDDSFVPRARSVVYISLRYERLNHWGPAWPPPRPSPLPRTA